MAQEKSHYSLDEAAAILDSTSKDLIHLAGKEELVLVVGVPDGIRFRTYDAHADRTEMPALLEPELLELSASQCQKIELNGRTEQSDFRAGYLIAPNGCLQRLMPSYGGRAAVFGSRLGLLAHLSRPFRQGDRIDAGAPICRR